MTKNKLNGCYDRPPFRDTLSVQDGWTKSGTKYTVEIPFRMDQECQYRHTQLGKADPGCVGCKWRDR